MLTVEQKRELLVGWARRQLLRPGYELMSRLSPDRFQIVNGLVLMIARLGLQSSTASASKLIEADAMWAEVAPYLHRPAPVLFQRADVQAWESTCRTPGGRQVLSLYRLGARACCGRQVLETRGGPRPGSQISLRPRASLVKLHSWNGSGLLGGCTAQPAMCLMRRRWRWTADPAAIHVGQIARLSWVSEGAATLEIDNGIGQVSPRVKGAIGVMPLVDTTYQITATGPAGTVPATDTAVVTIKTVPDAPVLSADMAGRTLNLAWLTPLGTLTGYRLEQSFDGTLWRTLRGCFRTRGADVYRVGFPWPDVVFPSLRAWRDRGIAPEQRGGCDGPCRVEGREQYDFPENGKPARHSNRLSSCWGADRRLYGG